MHLIGHMKQKSIARHTVILLAAVTLSAAMATGAMARGGGGGHGGGFGGGHMGGGFRGSFVNPVPSQPAPTFNPSSSYTVPQGRETPVSPGSPGSVFGNS
jgi:hypothetical protein